MKEKRNEGRKRRLIFLQRYVTFFLLMAAVITCCMILFLRTMQEVTGLSLEEGDIQLAAKMTFLNIVFLSLVCTAIDGIRHVLTVDRPVKQIIRTAERIMEGDFSARVPRIHSIDLGDGLDVIGKHMNIMAEELSGMETLRADFIANVSHELKTPLAVIQNYGTMLQQRYLPEEKRVEYAEAITESSKRLANLISNILKLNKLENQQIFPEKEVFDLGEQLCLCLLGFEGSWEEKRLEIDTDIEEGVCVESDAELLSLVWNNLISNAIKFTEPEGRISLSLKKEGDMAVIKVGDTGCGISRDVGPHIFEKFYQGDASRATGGNGLGLALVKRVMDIVEGDISVESQVGEGSEFTVKIRRKTDAAN